MDHLVVLFDANMTSYSKEGFLETHILDLVDAVIACLSAHKGSLYALWNVYSFADSVVHACASYRIFDEKLINELQLPEEHRRTLASTLKYCPTSRSMTGLALLSAIAAISRVQDIINALSDLSGIDTLYQGRVLIITASGIDDTETVNSALFSAKLCNIKIDIMSLTTTMGVNPFLKQVAYLTGSNFTEIAKPQTPTNNVSYFISQIFKASPSMEWRGLQLNDTADAHERENRLEFLGECNQCHRTINNGIVCTVCFNLQCDECFSGVCPKCSKKMSVTAQ